MLETAAPAPAARRERRKADQFERRQMVVTTANRHDQPPIPKGFVALLKCRYRTNAATGPLNRRGAAT
ncbi:hypothetical protein B0E45_11345 [Sinorhizobium sp. A49]|nr:hypothetical protein B0E45_11345 [Sinorhizobium sp. A49]